MIAINELQCNEFAILRNPIKIGPIHAKTGHIRKTAVQNLRSCREFLVLVLNRNV